MSEAAVAELGTTTPDNLQTPVDPAPAEETVVAPADGDTGGTETVDAASTESAPEATHYESFEEYEAATAGKESGPATPGPEQIEQAQPEFVVDPQVYGQAQRTYAQAAQRVQQTVGDLEKELVSDYAIPEGTARRIAKDLHDRVNELHAHGLNFYGLEAATKAEQRAVQQFNSQLLQGLQKGLPKDVQPEFQKWFGEAAQKSETGVVTHDQWVGKIAELSRKGYVTEAVVREEKRKAFNAGRGASEQAGDTPGMASNASPRGIRADTRNEDARLADPSTPIDEINRILARRRGQ